MTQEEIIKITVEMQQALSQMAKLRGELDKVRMAGQQGFQRMGTAILDADKQIATMGRSALGVFGNIGSAVLGIPGKLKEVGSSLTALGSRIQFVGFRLTSGLTLPIVALGKASFDVAKSIESEWVRVQKVYGDSATTAQEFASVQNSILRPAVLQISNKYKEHQTVIIDVMSTWAAAGKQGKELAEITEETLRVATLGEIDLAKATSFVKNVQAVYGLTVEGVRKEINAFNRIENETFLQMKDLAEAFPIASGAFKGFNLSAREGAAAIAGIAQRGGTATEAAQALKFSFSRLTSDMPKVNETLKELGVNLFDVNGNARKGTDVLKELANKVLGLNDEQRQAALSTLFGNRQITRMRNLLESVVDPTSDYSKALKVAADDTDNTKVAFRELNTILESQPKTWEGAMIAIENVLAVIGQRLAPVIIEVAKKVAAFTEFFVSLPDPVQIGVIALLAFLAALGPIVFIVGQATVVLGVLVSALGFLLSPIGLVVVALVGIGIIFARAALGSQEMRDDMVAAFNAVKDVAIKVWDKAVKPALETTVKVIENVGKTFADNWGKIKLAMEIFWIFAGPVLKLLWDTLLAVAETIFSQLKPAFDQIMAAIQPILPILAGIAAVLGVALLGAIIGVAAVISGIAVGLTQFFLGIVNVISGVLQFIQGFFKILIGIVTLNTDLIESGFRDAWAGILRVLQGFVQIFIGTIAGFVAGVLGFFANLVGNILGDKMPRLIQGILNWFKDLPGHVSRAISGIFGVFGNLVNGAYGWGRDMVQGFINGVKSLAGSLINAIKNLIPGPIKKMLGFSVPERGPLSDADKWMPHMIQLMQRGIVQNAPKLINTVENLAGQTNAAFGVTPTIGQGAGASVVSGAVGSAGPTFIDQSFIYQPQQSFATPAEIRNLERMLQKARAEEAVRRGEV